MKYLIVTHDSRIPPELQDKTYDKWSLDQFLAAGNSDEGLEIPDGGIYYNLDSLNQEIFESMEEFGLVPVYYKWEDQVVNKPSGFAYNVQTYPVEKPVVEEPEVEVQSVQEEKSAVEIPQEPQVEVKQVESEPVVHNESEATIGDIQVIDNPVTDTSSEVLDKDNLINLIGNKFESVVNKPKNTAAKTILFGSSKGGTGKSTTCLISARRYAKTHPNERVALADFDIVDGQIGISILKPSPTLRDYYKQYKYGNIGFEFLNNVAIKSEHFSPNLDFYLAPPINIPEVTNDDEFWKNVFELLIMNYDTVFFDSGIDYLGQRPISKLYNIVDKIILTCNTSVNAVNSVVKEIQNLKGEIPNNVFKPETKIVERLNVVLTRVMPNSSTNDLVIKAITDNGVPIIAAFGNLDDMINRSQWWQQWEVWDKDDNINKYLDRITTI